MINFASLLLSSAAAPASPRRQAYRNSIVVGEDRHVSVWSLCRGQRSRLTRASFCEHQRPIRRLELMGRWIVTCSGDYVIRLWDSKTGVCIRELGVSMCKRLRNLRLFCGFRGERVILCFVLCPNT